MGGHSSNPYCSRVSYIFPAVFINIKGKIKLKLHSGFQSSRVLKLLFNFCPDAIVESEKGVSNFIVNTLYSNN